MRAAAVGVEGVGYEGLELEVFVSRLVGRRVRVLADVRLTPVSRKRGFSKRMLAEALTTVGIDYLHLPELGNPKANRPGFAGTPKELADARGRYVRLLGVDEAGEALDRLTVIARQGLVAVMCFEADEERCHRQVVLSEVRHRLECDLARA